MTCDYVLDELRRNFVKKFPNQIDALNSFFLTLAMEITIVHVSYKANDLHINIRDEYDKPILKAALDSKCDIIISGDKDFLEAGLECPKVLKAVDFYNNY